MTRASNGACGVNTADYDCLDKSVTNCKNRKNRKKRKNGQSDNSTEREVVSYFLQLHSRMRDTAAGMNIQLSEGEQVPTHNYTVQDHQDDKVSDSGLKPDVVLYYGCKPDIARAHIVVEAKFEPKKGKIDDRSLGQIADYALLVWKNQPTRTFVPILFVHSTHVDLLLFTRGKWYRASIGDILFSRAAPNENAVKHVRETMAAIWFILTLSPDRFGHFCDVRDGFGSLIFTHGQKDKANASAEARARAAVIVPDAGAHCVKLVKPMRRPVRLHGRLAYLFEATYGSEKAFLKLSWTPVNRQPEGAVYDALAAKKVGGVPKVFDSGMLCSDLFGFRLEYIVLQHCGDTLDEHLARLQSNHVEDDRIQAKVVKVIQDVSKCLVSAWNADIIHRDISTGNIAVDGDKVTVIDWGYAKVCRKLPELEGVEKRWDIDFGKIGKVETKYDKQTGTARFMSIRVLFEREERDIYDDLESLFYVALYAIGTLCDKKIDNADGFQFFTGRNLALVRASVLGNSKRYLKRFGLSKFGVILIHDGLRKVFDAMHQCLFWTDSEYIGNILWEDEYFRREPDWQQAAKFMDEPTVQMLKLAQSAQGGDHAPPPVALVP
ncbi:Mitogen-activated protein kinase 3, partial [Coemansia nantahalensis]